MLEPFDSVYFHHFHSAKVVSQEYDLPLVQFFRSARTSDGNISKIL